MKHINKIGKKIKVFREFRQISIDDLALSANLDIAQLEHIENRGNVPSLGHLIKISRALGVSLGTFLDEQERVGPVVNKSGDEKVSISFSTKDDTNKEHLNFFSLAANKSGRHMEPFLIEIEPQKETDYKLSTHEGEEFIFVLEGEIEINYGRDTFILNQGDSIYLDSIVAHNIHAAGINPAKIIGVVYTPV